MVRPEGGLVPCETRRPFSLVAFRAGRRIRGILTPKLMNTNADCPQLLAMRGLAKVRAEWQLVCLAHNLRKLARASI